MDENEQLESLKKWWQENSRSLVLGIAIGISSVSGWWVWNNYQVEQSLAASEIYRQLLLADKKDNVEDAEEQANKILQQYSHTTYSNMASLFLAKYAIEKEEYAVARVHLEQVLNHADQAQLIQVARLRLARVLVAEEKFSEALYLLNTVDVGKFAVQYYELKGDTFLLQGNLGAARVEYRRAQTEIGEAKDAMLEMKLESLGG